MGFRTCHRLNQYTGYYKYIEMNKTICAICTRKDSTITRTRTHTQTPSINMINT